MERNMVAECRSDPSHAHEIDVIVCARKKMSSKCYNEIYAFNTVSRTMKMVMAQGYSLNDCGHSSIAYSMHVQ